MRNKLIILAQAVDENDDHRGFFLDWLREFAQHYQIVSVISVRVGTYSLPQNVHVYSLGKEHHAAKLLQAVRWFKHLFQLMPGSCGIFAHASPIFVIASWPVSVLFRKRIVLWYTHKAVTFKLWIAEKLVSTIFTASPESFRLQSRKVIVTGHGINTTVFQPDMDKRIHDGITRILSVGRISPIKHYEVLIDAARHLKQKGYLFSVTIVGEPTRNDDVRYQARLLQAIHDAGLEQDFHFRGKVFNRDLPAYYQSHDLLVHTSQTGSLDKTVLEAMACGMIVLSSNDASRRFLPHEWLFQQGNSLELAEKIQNPAAKYFNARCYVVEHHDVRTLIDKINKMV